MYRHVHVFSAHCVTFVVHLEASFSTTIFCRIESLQNNRFEINVVFYIPSVCAVFGQEHDVAPHFGIFP